MTQKQRAKEVREILALDTDELVKRAKGQLILFPTLDEVYDYLAEEMVNEFQKAAEGDKIVSFIMPVGPTQPYRLMAEKINYRQLNLKNVRFFFMDEYVDDAKDKLTASTRSSPGSRRTGSRRPSSPWRGRRGTSASASPTRWTWSTTSRPGTCTRRSRSTRWSTARWR